MRRGAWLGENRRRLLVLAALLAVAVLAVGWWRPWRVSGQPPGPTPRPTLVSSLPTSTAGAIPDRLIEPTASPTVAALLPAATPATPPPAATPAPGDAGGLIYLGRFNGRPGIVAANGDGSGRRLIAPGVYLALAWSPDGARFAALGGIDHEQIAIFDGAGRPLARHALRPGTDCELRWSPDSRFVVCVPLYPFQGRERTSILIADEAGVREVLVPPVVRTSFLGWPRPGVLGLLALPEEWPYAAAEVWQIDLASGDVRRLIQGDFWPLGWSADGRALLALGGRQPRGGTVQSGEPVFTELIAVDTANGERRTLERAHQLALTLPGPLPAGRYWFSNGTLSPTGGQIALWLSGEPTSDSPGAVNSASQPTLAMIVLRDTGEIATISAVKRNVASVSRAGWSPDGLKLALPGYDRQNGARSLEIVTVIAGGTLNYRMSGNDDVFIAWSTDGRRFAFVTLQGLAVASVGDPGTSLIDPEGRAPAWRPFVR